MKEFSKIVGFASLAAILYGLVQDQIAIRICPEYFTVWHPTVVNSDNLTVVALVWGVLATWWVGLSLGVALGLAATAGSGAAIESRAMVRPILLLIGFTAALTVGIGLIAWAMKFHVPTLGEELQGAGDPTRLGILFAAYNASYAGAFFGGVWLCVHTWKSRRRPLGPAES